MVTERLNLFYIILLIKYKSFTFAHHLNKHAKVKKNKFVVFLRNRK